MEKFEVTVLGCGCATPTMIHNPASQVVNIREKLSLIDCGEGTQLQLRINKIAFMKIRNIFISHLHGDHCFGLMGLISSMGLLGRASALHIYAPKELEEILDYELKLYCAGMEYEVVFHPVNTTEHQVIYEDRSMVVESLPLRHRVPCCGFLFREKPTMAHIRRDMIDYYHIPFSEINNIKAGKDWITDSGDVVPNARLTTPPDPVRSYAYCSDTAYIQNLYKLVKGVDLLYHEATFGNDKLGRARQTFHSTAEQAAKVARDAQCKQLMIGHYSAHYTDETMLLRESQSVFPQTIAACEGLTVKL